LSSAAGPGTTFDVVVRPGNWKEVLGRFCFDVTTIPAGVTALVTGHWPQLFGTATQPLLQLGIDSHVSQGMNGSWILLAAAMTIAVARVVFHVVRERALRPEHEIFAYLTLIGAISATVFAIGRCGGIAPFRYDLLSVLAAVGVSGWYLAVEPSRGLRAAWVL